MKSPEFCTLCDLLNTENSSCLHEFGKAMHIDIPDMKNIDCPIDDDDLDAKKYTLNYRMQTFYLTVVLKDKMPWEIFMEITIKDPSKDIHDLRYMLSSIDCTTRFISYVLQNAPLETSLKHLRRSSRNKDDIPGIILSKLEKWNGKI